MKITTKNEALNIVETSYLASLSSLLWVALYYLPIGGALLRLILPLPIILLHLRRGTKVDKATNLRKKPTVPSAAPIVKLNPQLFSLNQHQPNQKANIP